MSVFDLLKGSNEYPIVFIGSGISKDMFKNFQVGQNYWNHFGIKLTKMMTFMLI